MEVILSRCSPEIRKVFQLRDSSVFSEDQSEGNEREPTQEPNEWSLAPVPLAGNAHLAHQVERADRLQQLTDLSTQGITQKEIARRLGIGERTVRHWLTRGIPYGTPESRRKRQKVFDPYASYVEERFRQGCHSGQELWREITAQGYKGSCRTVYRFLEARRVNVSPLQGQVERPQTISASRAKHFSAQQAVWLFVRDPGDMKEKEQEELTIIRQASPTADTLYALAQQFMSMIRQLKGEHLDNWLGLVRASQIPELQPLRKSIERDKAAVLAGLTLPYNNGVVEGKVNKLKLIKRMMYGRAGFPLLRQRVLHFL
jgi:transposase